MLGHEPVLAEEDSGVVNEDTEISSRSVEIRKRAQ